MLPQIIMFVSMVVIHLFIMPFTMIALPTDFQISRTQLYAATFMGACMMAVETIMHPMDFIGWGITLLLLTGSLILLRWQIGVSDDEYLKDMIPHHSMAVLTSEARVQSAKNPQVLGLAQSILRTQRDEIVQMKKMLIK
jgi:uncharacterized protein (DUF305 family)